MGTVKTLKAKLIVILIVFMILFSNFGFTLSAIATSDEFEVINRGFFRKDEIKFDAYFEDEDGNKVTELTKNVNENIKLVLEILPQVEGFLQDGKIRAVSADGSDLGFKFSTVSQNLLTTTKSEVNILDAIKDIENVLEEPKTEVEKTDDEKGEEPKTDSDTNTVNVDSSIQSILDKVSDKVQQADSDVVKTNPLASILDVIGEEILVDENVIVEDEDEKEETFEDKIKDALLDITVESENEILLSNIIEDTKIVVDLEFVSGDKLDINNLLEEVKLQLSGTFINKNLKEVKIGKEEKVTVGWEYSKDIVVSSEYTKFSPFSVMNVSGTIVQNDITIKRNIEENKHLPIKSTTIEVDVPKINDQAPIEINVVTNKTLATNGEDVGETTFSRNNWSYDKENNKITIKTINKEGNTAVYSQGEDQYVIIYRFKDFIEEEKYNLLNKLTVKVDEYSAKTNTIIKKIEETKEVEVRRDELLTSSVGTSSDKINKSKINANYNSEVPMYETEYKTQVNINILTSDILEKVTINASKEMYKGNMGLDFEANNVKIKEIDFNENQLNEILQNGGEIIVKNLNDEQLLKINKDSISNDGKYNLDNVIGIIVELVGIKSNGTIDFELTKIIDKCSYDKELFNKNITHIESIIDLKVKYIGMSEEVQLSPMATKKEFDNSYTSAVLTLNKEKFSVSKTNANVEFRIGLNNDDLNSDLYINPSFEIAFPVNVKEVRLGSVNILNGDEFAIADFSTYRNVDDTQRIKVDLAGIQTKFKSSVVDGGTNIIINADIIVDAYTSTKDDQVKLYYCNEGVTNYNAQTKWSIIKDVNPNILKQTNGYDAERIRFQGVDGLLAVNGIVNYDGQSSVLRSIKQGTQTIRIPKEGNSQIATMELVVLNNTNNTCLNTVLLGRIPFEGNKDVVTGKDLGTSIDTVMKSLIRPSEYNDNKVKIYYSTNPNADADLNKEGNGWETGINVRDTLKSYLIVVEGEVKPGATLKFEYDFEIPSNLGYDASITGSFGAFYNEQSTILLKNKIVSADKVGLTTEVGAKYEATLSVDIGEDKPVGEARIINYKVTVKNTGSVDLNNIKIINKNLLKTGKVVNAEKTEEGNSIYYIDKLKVGQSADKTITVKTGTIPKTLLDYALTFENVVIDVDENNNQVYYVVNEKNEREYITEMPNKFYIENFATVYADEVKAGQKTNIIRNELQESKFDISLEEYNRVGDLNPGEEFKYIVDIINISEQDMHDIVVEDVLPKEVKYLKVEQADTHYEVDFDEEENKVSVSVGTLEAGRSTTYFIHCGVITKNIGEVQIYNSATVHAKDSATEYSNVLASTIKGPELAITQESNAKNNTVNETDEFEVILNIVNRGEGKSKTINFEMELPEILKIKDIVSEGKRLIKYTENNNIITAKLYELEAHDIASLIVKVQAYPLDEEEANRIVEVKTNLSEEYIGEINVTPLSITILDKEDRELVDDEKEQIREDNTIKDTDEEVKDEDTFEKDVIENQDKPSSDNNVNNNTNNNTNNENNNVDDELNNDNTSNNDETNQPSTENENVSEDETIPEESENVETAKSYKITGEVWKDDNKNNAKEKSEDRLNQIQVSLYRGADKIKSVLTDSTGRYRLTDIPSGKYTIRFDYDGKEYIAAQYKVSGIDDSINSDAIEEEEGRAISDNIEVVDRDIMVDLGLQKRDNFDISVNKYISTSTVIRNGKEKVEKYDKNTKISKLEIRSKELENTEIKLEYSIVIKNEGTVNGVVETVKDYLPKTLSFNEKDNVGWQLGKDGVLYNETLYNTVLKPGETKELKLVLNKIMTEDNTGTISNKVEITGVKTEKALDENEENNVATQEMIITVGTGRVISILVLFAFVIANVVLITGIKTGKIKKVYK